MLKNNKTKKKTGPSSAGLKSVLWVIKCAFMKIHGWKEKYCPEARQTLIFFSVKSATGCTLLSMLLLINMSPLLVVALASEVGNMGIRL